MKSITTFDLPMIQIWRCTHLSTRELYPSLASAGGHCGQRARRVQPVPAGARKQRGDYVATPGGLWLREEAATSFFFSTQYYAPDEPVEMSQFRYSQFVLARSDYNAATFEAPAARAGAAVNVLTDRLPNPFPRIKRQKLAKKGVSVKRECCSKCSWPTNLDVVSLRPATCDSCHETCTGQSTYENFSCLANCGWTFLDLPCQWHLGCANLRFPPKRGSWQCPRCEGTPKN